MTTATPQPATEQAKTYTAEEVAQAADDDGFVLMTHDCNDLPFRAPADAVPHLAANGWRLEGGDPAAAPTSAFDGHGQLVQPFGDVGGTAGQDADTDSGGDSLDGHGDDA